MIRPALDETRTDEAVEVLARRVVVQTDGTAHGIERQLALLLEHVQDLHAAR